MSDRHERRNRDAKRGGHGAAIYTCFEQENDEGPLKLWVENEEYASQVDYCPFCGYEAQITIAEAEPDEPRDSSGGDGIPPCNNGMVNFSEE